MLIYGGVDSKGNKVYSRPIRHNLRRIKLGMQISSKWEMPTIDKDPEDGVLYDDIFSLLYNYFSTMHSIANTFTKELMLKKNKKELEYVLNLMYGQYDHAFAGSKIKQYKHANISTTLNANPIMAAELNYYTHRHILTLTDSYMAELTSLFICPKHASCTGVIGMEISTSEDIHVDDLIEAINKYRKPIAPTTITQDLGFGGVKSPDCFSGFDYSYRDIRPEKRGFRLRLIRPITLYGETMEKIEDKL
jgi:hypothetical protein